jgi:hypothetical protein
MRARSDTTTAVKNALADKALLLLISMYRQGKTLFLDSIGNDESIINSWVTNGENDCIIFNITFNSNWRLASNKTEFTLFEAFGAVIKRLIAAARGIFAEQRFTENEIDRWNFVHEFACNAEVFERFVTLIRRRVEDVFDRPRQSSKQNKKSTLRFLFLFDEITLLTSKMKPQDGITFMATICRWISADCGVVMSGYERLPDSSNVEEHARSQQIVLIPLSDAEQRRDVFVMTTAYFQRCSAFVGNRNDASSVCSENVADAIYFHELAKSSPGVRGAILFELRRGRNVHDALKEIPVVAAICASKNRDDESPFSATSAKVLFWKSMQFCAVFNDNKEIRRKVRDDCSAATKLKIAHVHSFNIDFGETKIDDFCCPLSSVELEPIFVERCFECVERSESLCPWLSEFFRSLHSFGRTVANFETDVKLFDQNNQNFTRQQLLSVFASEKNENARLDRKDNLDTKTFEVCRLFPSQDCVFRIAFHFGMRRKIDSEEGKFITNCMDECRSASSTSADWSVPHESRELLWSSGASTTRRLADSTLAGAFLEDAVACGIAFQMQCRQKLASELPGAAQSSTFHNFLHVAPILGLDVAIDWLPKSDDGEPAIFFIRGDYPICSSPAIIVEKISSISNKISSICSREPFGASHVKPNIVFRFARPESNALVDMFFYLRDASKPGKFVEVRVDTKFVREGSRLTHHTPDRLADLIKKSLKVVSKTEAVSHVVHIIASPVRYSDAEKKELEEALHQKNVTFPFSFFVVPLDSLGFENLVSQVIARSIPLRDQQESASWCQPLDVPSTWKSHRATITRGLNRCLHNDDWSGFQQWRRLRLDDECVSTLASFDGAEEMLRACCPRLNSMNPKESAESRKHLLMIPFGFVLQNLGLLAGTKYADISSLTRFVSTVDVMRNKIPTMKLFIAVDQEFSLELNDEFKKWLFHALTIGELIDGTGERSADEWKTAAASVTGQEATMESLGRLWNAPVEYTHLWKGSNSLIQSSHRFFKIVEGKMKELEELFNSNKKCRETQSRVHSVVEQANLLLQKIKMNTKQKSSKDNDDDEESRGKFLGNLNLIKKVKK